MIAVELAKFAVLQDAGRKFEEQSSGTISGSVAHQGMKSCRVVEGSL
jgi:hypothetical protein